MTVPGVVARPSRRDLGLLTVAVLAIGTAAPLVVATAAPALAIAFWRNAFATVAIAPFVLVRHRRELLSLDRQQWRLSALAGLLLAGHFATWMPSLLYTSVASSTALLATQPVWAALMARAGGVEVPRRAWYGIGISLVGVLVLTGVDLSLSLRALGGDLLALAGAVLAAGYVTVGSRVRATVSTTTYTFVCYGICALLLLAVCLVGGQQLGGYPPTTWTKLLALTVGAQLLGHSLVNVVLRTTSATVVSLGLLFEMPTAALVAWVWLGQRPPLGVIPGAVLLLAGVAVVVRSGREPAGVVEAPPG